MDNHELRVTVEKERSRYQGSDFLYTRFYGALAADGWECEVTIDPALLALVPDPPVGVREASRQEFLLVPIVDA